MARTFNWSLATGTSGTFSDPASWTDTTDGNPGVPATMAPGPGDIAFVNDATILGGGTVATLGFAGTTTIDGTIDVTAKYNLFVASDTTLDIVAGGVLVAPNFYLGYGDTTGVRINVEAGGTLASVGLTAADNDLSVRIAALAGSQIAVDVSGTGASLDSGGWTVWVGEAGSGTLSVEGGAHASDGTLDIGTFGPYSTEIGVAAGSHGTLTVSGADSTYSVAGTLAVGDHGQGALAVLAGGAVQAGGGVVLGAGGGTGTVLVDGGSLSVGTDLNLNAGSLLALAEGGTVTVAGSVVLASGAVITGAGGIAGGIADDGLAAAAGGTLELAGAVTGGGTLSIADGATLLLDSTAAAGLAVVFQSGSGEVLSLATPLGMDAVIDGLGVGDAIRFAGSYASVGGSFAGNVFTVTGDGATIAQLHFASGYSNANVAVSDTGGVVAITGTAPCFLAGTPILTARGEVAVEHLRVGDRVVTLSGRGAPLKPIRWIGHTRFDAARHPRPEQVIPIRITAGALADGMPQCDLLVSPGHALLLDGVLIQAERLVNGATIVRDTGITRGGYFHVELEQHDIVLSAGVPSESYLDTGNRAAFHGAAELHPDFSAKHWSDTCVALVQEGPVLASVKARLLRRAGEAGFETTRDAGLHVVADGRVVAAERLGERRFGFAVPPGCRDIRLVSRGWVPSELLAESTDMRRLGVFVSRLEASGAQLSLDQLGEGWHGLERDEAGCRRWTDGAALLPAWVTELVVELWSGARYWTHLDTASELRGYNSSAAA